MVLRCIAARQAKLLSILRQELSLSSGLIKRLKYDHAFRVNGVPVYTNYLVCPGDEVTVTLQDAVPEYPAEDGPISILYEDDAILVVDKPAGLIIHPTPARITGTLANRVIGYYRRTGQLCAFHPVTRLDRDTFGVVLLAKNAHIHARLCAAMQQGAIHKTYRALVCGGPDSDCGIIDAPIIRPDPMRMIRAIGAGGQAAVTEYRVLERRPDCTLLQLHPKTGRTHQLRLHCLYQGFPILGDPQYYTKASAALSAALGLSSQLLCACALTFPHPLTGEICTLQSAQADLLSNIGRKNTKNSSF